MQKTNRPAFQSLIVIAVLIAMAVLLIVWIRSWLYRSGEQNLALAATLPSAPAVVTDPTPPVAVLPPPPAIIPSRAPAKPVSSAQPAGPRVGSAPISTQFLHNPQKSMITAVHFLNHGQQLGRYGGKLNRDDKGNFTGNSYLDVCDLPDGSPTYMSEKDGFPVFNVAFTADGHRAIFSSVDWQNQGHGHLYLADFADDFGGATVTKLESIAAWEMALAISDDGQLAATHQNNSQQVHLWDLTAGRQIGTLEAQTSVGQLQFDHAGKHLIVAAGYGGDSSVQIWDIATQKQLVKCAGHTNDIRALSIASDDSTIASADADGAIWIWSNPTGKPIGRFTCAYQSISALDISPDGRRLLATSSEATDETAKKPWIQMDRVRVWDIASGKELIRFEKADFPITAATFNPDGTSVLVFQGGQVKTYALPADLPQASLQEIADHAGQTLTVPVDGEICKLDCDGNWAVNFAKSDKSLFTGGMGGFAAYDLSSGKKTDSFSCQLPLLINPAADLCISEETRGEHGLSVVYQLSTARVLNNIDPPGFPYIDASALSNDGKLLALAGGCMKERISPVFKPQFQIFNTADASCICTIKQHNDDVRCMAFAPDASRLYVAGGWRDNELHDASVRVVDPANGHEMQVIDGLTEVPKAMAISQDGKQLYIVGDGGTVACMDTTTGKLRTGSRLGQAWSIAVSPDGRRLAVGLMGNIAVLDAQSLRTIVTLRRHRGPVMSMSFSSDGNRLASVSTDKTLRVFDLQKAIDEQSQQ